MNTPLRYLTLTACATLSIAQNEPDLSWLPESGEPRQGYISLKNVYADGAFHRIYREPLSPMTPQAGNYRTESNGIRLEPMFAEGFGVVVEKVIPIRCIKTGKDDKTRQERFVISRPHLNTEIELIFENESDRAALMATEAMRRGNFTHARVRGYETFNAEEAPTTGKAPTWPIRRCFVILSLSN